MRMFSSSGKLRIPTSVPYSTLLVYMQPSSLGAQNPKLAYMHSSGSEAGQVARCEPTLAQNVQKVQKV